MAIGSVGSSDLNRVLLAAARIQAIGHDSHLSSASRRQMTAEIEKETSGILDAARFKDEADSRSSLVASAAAADDVAVEPGTVADQPIAHAQGSSPPRAGERTISLKPARLGKGAIIDELG